jgi:hypothetical protein
MIFCSQVLLISLFAVGRENPGEENMNQSSSQHQNQENEQDHIPEFPANSNNDGALVGNDPDTPLSSNASTGIGKLII